MKKHQLITLIVTIMIASTLFINIGNASDQTTYTIQSSGSINPESTKLTVILRNTLLFAGSKTEIENHVDTFVLNHPHVTAVTIMDMHQYGIWWYGYSFNKNDGKWMGASFIQIKTMIDRFHYHGWQVGLETTGIAWNNQEEYNYITKLHPELALTDANGFRATGIDDSIKLTKNPGYNRVIPNFFAKFATDDIVNNITKGTRLIDLYTNRLSQLIQDGLEFDFWFGTDGWNGFNMQGYYWNSPIASSCYSFDEQLEYEYGNWSQAILPKNWDIMNQVQKANAIISNQTILDNWWFYWQNRFAEMYSQIRQVFIDTGRPGPFYTIGTVDASSLPQGGNLSPTGMYNISLLTQYNAFDYYYNDVEGVEKAGATYAIGRESAYAAAIVKMQAPKAKLIIGLQFANIESFPSWTVKQQYLSQAINYIWHNGEIFRIADPTIVMIQYPSLTGYLGWEQEEIEEVFNWISKQATLLNTSKPVWLGPVYILANGYSGAEGNAWCGLNFSFAQWAWSNNLKNNPSFINTSMGTLLLDASLQDTGPQLIGNSEIVMNYLINNKLNVWYWEVRGWRISSAVFGEGSDTKFEDNIGLKYNPGVTKNTYTILNSTNDYNANWIISGYEGVTCKYNFYDQPSPYLPSKGFISIANTSDTPNRTGAGIYYNNTTGHFAFTHYGSYQQNSGISLPRGLLNRMLYWVADCPVNSSEPLIDIKIEKAGDSLLLPMTNQKDVGNVVGSSMGWTITTILDLDENMLNLGKPEDYLVYWASELTPIIFSSWNNIKISLSGMADTLVIMPKN